MLSAETAAELDRLERLLVLERELARRRENDPLSMMSWLPAQLAFLAEPAKRKLLRAGNQGQGKTTVGAAEAHYFALGAHPFQAVPPPPTFQWAICATEKQSQIVQRKVWELAPKDEVAPGCYFDPRKGAFVGRYPVMRYRNGSWLGFITGGGDTTNLASETLHRIWFDEPPESERVWNEALKRVLRTNGWVATTMTPVNRPVDWLKQKCEDGLVRDLHFQLEPQHLVFASGPQQGRVITLDDGTPCDQAWIDKLIAETSDMEVPVTIHGGFEFRLEGAYLDKVWDPARMIVDATPGGEFEELLGIDMGVRPGKQIALYILVDPKGGRHGHPHIHVEDEYVGKTGRETSEDDAAGILRMLKDRGSKWSKLDGVMSDRDERKRGRQKTTGDLQRAVAESLGLDFHALRPSIRVAKQGRGRGGGSVATRSRWLHAQMARCNFTVNRRCKRFIEAAPKYSPLNEDDWKDPFDALLYGVDKFIYAAERGSRGARVESW